MDPRARHHLELHAGINFSRLQIGGDLGGCMFVLGSVLVLVAGLPEVRWFVLASLATAVPIACLLLAWHRHHEGPSHLWRPIDLDLSGSPRPDPERVGARPVRRTMLQEARVVH